MPLPPEPEQIAPPPAPDSSRDADKTPPQELDASSSASPNWVFSPRIPDTDIKKSEVSVEVKPTDGKNAGQGAAH
jgi:hypothetical protein